MLSAKFDFMNYWTKLSIEYANQRSYLDDLFNVYPTIPEGIREVHKESWELVEKAFQQKDNDTLVRELLKFKLFPIKDSYVAYLKRDPKSIERNPQTINRICGRLYEMGLNKIYERCSEQKKTNRQIGAMFNNWIKKKCLGIMPCKLEEFLATNENAILGGSDADKKKFAKTSLNYHKEGLDLVARFNGKYVIGEVKFLSDFANSQDSSFEDALATLEAKDANAIKILILDGDIYKNIKSNTYHLINNPDKDYNIISILVISEFLYSL